MAQVWPNPDGLDHTGTFGVAWGSYLGGWIGARMDAGTDWGTGKLMTRQADVSVQSPDAMCIASSAFEGKRHGFVRRDEIVEVGGSSAYGRADGVFYTRIESPNVAPHRAPIAGYAMRGGCGVLARVIGGTLVEPGAGNYDPVVYLDRPSGYAAFVRGNVTNGKVDVVLERWNAGTRTQLALTTLTPISPSFYVPWVLRLEMQNSGTQVTLTVSLKNVAAREGLFGFKGGGVGGTPSWSTLDLSSAFTQVFQYADTSGSRLASQGRSGIVLDKENRIAVSPITLDTDAHCRMFEAATTGVVRLREEWQRWIQVGRDETSRWSDTGWNAAPDMAFDRFAELFRQCQQTPYLGGATYTPANGVQGFPIAKRSSGSFGVEVTIPQSSPAQEQLALVPRELPDAGRARFKATFAHVVAGAGEDPVRFGVALRMTQIENDGFDGTYRDAFQGYVFEIGGDGRCAIKRRRFAANALNTDPLDDTVELATVDIAHSTSARVLQVEAVDDDTPDPPGTGPVLLRMWLDGIQVVFTTGLIAGVSAAADGTVRDAGGGRILGAKGVGLFFAFPATGAGVTRTIEVHGLESATPTGAILPDSELANVVLRDETSNASGTLTITPSWTLPIEPAREAILTDFVTGNAAARPATNAERHPIEVGFRALQDDDMRALEAFYDAHGLEVPFAWNIAPEGERKYVFASRLQQSEIGPGLWDARTRVVEVIDAA